MNCNLCGRWFSSSSPAGDTCFHCTGNKTIMTLVADRDRWKARAEALEMAARDFESADGIFSFACFSCIYKDQTDPHICQLLGDDVCETLENWEFDEARFSAEKDGESFG